VQGGGTIAVARGAVSAGTSGSETFSRARTSPGGTERRGATFPAARGGHGSEGLGLPLLAGGGVRTEREYVRCARRVPAGVATEPGQQRSEDAADGAGGEVKSEVDKTSAKSGIEIAPALSVEIRVREQNAEIEAASESEVAVFTAAQGWV